MTTSFDFLKGREIVLAQGNRAERLFEAFKLANKLDSSATLSDVACQRLLKIGHDAPNPYFRNYYGVTVAIPVPLSALHRLSSVVDHLKSELRARSIDRHFLFLPESTYHVTLYGILERPEPPLEQEEVAYYVAALDDIQRELTVVSGSTAKSKEIGYAEEFVIYFHFELDPEPRATLELLRKAFGHKSLYTGDYHLTICYQSEPLRSHGLKLVRSAISSCQELLPRGGITFAANSAEVFEFESMEHYRLLGTKAIGLA